MEYYRRGVVSNKKGMSPGVPASVRSTLFDPFVTAGKPNGTGLGLTLARRIAEEHGVSACLEESNRERTVFTLSLP